MKWRRGAAAVCGAFVLWLAAVCAGSQDLRAAAQAVRDSSLAQRLVQWELGDLWAADSLPLPVLTVLRQSPMLLAAETQVTQAETPRNAEETPSPAPVETPEGPTTEQTENTGGQGESRPLSVVAADENGYTRVGDVFIKNSSRQTVEGIVFDGTFAAALGEDAPQVLIVHTHGSEAYTMPPGEEYEDTGSFRTADASVSVIRVGDELARVLSGYGISVLHDRALYDDPEYNGAYYRAEDAIEAYMEKYPSIGFILDVHRDALEDKAGHQYKVVTREDPDCAQVSLVMGSSWEGWQENLKFAVAVQQHLTERYPTLMRPLTLRNSDYNEYFTPGSLLVEIGAAGNSLDEALKAVRVFGEGFAEVVTGNRVAIRVSVGYNVENLSKKTIPEGIDYETEPRLYIDGNADRGGDHRCAGGYCHPCVQRQPAQGQGGRRHGQRAGVLRGIADTVHHHRRIHRHRG